MRTIIIPVPHCTVCGNLIPEDHPKRKSTLTCSDECRDTREAWRRAKKDIKACRYCEHPATPAERARYKRWRNWEKKNPPPDAELSPAEIEEREYRKANPPQKRGPKPKPPTEREDDPLAKPHVRTRQKGDADQPAPVSLEEIRDASEEEADAATLRN